MVSIIIPVYNSGNALNKCVDSVVKQTYSDLQIILVNDCSTDARTNAIIENWKNRDERIILINKDKNEGIEKARFTGLEHVTGSYLMFMDHDDWLFSYDVIQIMMDNMLATDADVVMGRSYEQKLFFKRAIYDPTPKGIIEQPELKEKYYISFFGVNIIPVLVWAKIYKMDVIKAAKLKPRGLRDTDDVNFNMWVFPYVQRFSVIDDFVYVHRWGGFSSKLIDFIPEYKRLYKERRNAIKEFDYEKAVKSINIQMKNLLYFDLSLKIERKNYKKNDILEYLKNELADEFWNDVTNPNVESDFTEALRLKDYERMDSIIRKSLESPKRRVVSFLKKIGRPIIRYILEK